MKTLRKSNRRFSKRVSATALRVHHPMLTDALLHQIRPELFWDVDSSHLNSQIHARYIIERVAERGNMDEMRMVWNHYGSARIAHALLAARGLSARTVAFFANHCDLPRSAFRSWKKGGANAIPV